MARILRSNPRADVLPEKQPSFGPGNELPRIRNLAPGAQVAQARGQSLRNDVQGLSPISAGTPKAIRPQGALRSAVDRLATSSQVAKHPEMLSLDQDLERGSLEARMRREGSIGTPSGGQLRFELQERHEMQQKKAQSNLDLEARQFAKLEGSLSPEQRRQVNQSSLLEAAKRSGNQSVIDLLQLRVDQESAGVGPFDRGAETARADESRITADAASLDRAFSQAQQMERGPDRDTVMSGLRERAAQDPALQKKSKFLATERMLEEANVLPLIRKSQTRQTKASLRAGTTRLSSSASSAFKDGIDSGDPEVIRDNLSQFMKDVPTTLEGLNIPKDQQAKMARLMAIKHIMTNVKDQNDVTTFLGSMKVTHNESQDVAKMALDALERIDASEKKQDRDEAQKLLKKQLSEHESKVEEADALGTQRPQRPTIKIALDAVQELRNLQERQDAELIVQQGGAAPVDPGRDIEELRSMVDPDALVGPPEPAEPFAQPQDFQQDVAQATPETSTPEQIRDRKLSITSIRDLRQQLNNIPAAEQGQVLQSLFGETGKYKFLTDEAGKPRRDIITAMIRGDIEDVLPAPRSARELIDGQTYYGVFSPALKDDEGNVLRDVGEKELRQYDAEKKIFRKVDV